MYICITQNFGNMVTFDELRQLASINICNGAFESWGAQKTTENDNELKIHVDGLLLTGYVIVSPTNKEKYYNVEFVAENGEKVSDHTTSRNNLPKLIDAHVERAKEWSDEEYKRRYLEKAKALNIDDLYDAMEKLRRGLVEHIMLFNEDGTPLDCTREGNTMVVRNSLTNEIIYQIGINTK